MTETEVRLKCIELAIIYSKVWPNEIEGIADRIFKWVISTVDEYKIPAGAMTADEIGSLMKEQEII